MEMKPIDKLVYLLMVVGALVWGFVGFFNYNPVDKLFGMNVNGARVVYAAIGLAGLWGLGTILMMMSNMNAKPAAKKKKK